MKLRDDDKSWLRSAVAEEVATRLASIQDSLKPHGFRRVTFWLKEWGAISALWAVPASLVAASITLGIVATNRISSNAILQTNAARDIKSVQQDLANLTKRLAQQDIVYQASMSPTAFAASLPELKVSLSQAAENKAEVPHRVITELQEKLVATDQTSPGYWPAAGEFISFRDVSYRAADLRQRDLKACSRSDYHPATVAEAAPPGATLIKFNLSYFESCLLNIDSLQQAEQVGRVGANAVGGRIAFKHCLIIYRGGDTELFQHFSFVLFEDSQWDISLPNSPPPKGKHFTELLLAANPSEFAFPAL